MAISTPKGYNFDSSPSKYTKKLQLGKGLMLTKSDALPSFQITLNKPERKTYGRKNRKSSTEPKESSSSIKVEPNVDKTVMVEKMETGSHPRAKRKLDDSNTVTSFQSGSELIPPVTPAPLEFEQSIKKSKDSSDKGNSVVLESTEQAPVKKIKKTARKTMRKDPTSAVKVGPSQHLTKEELNMVQNYKLKYLMSHNCESEKKTSNSPMNSSKSQPKETKLSASEENRSKPTVEPKTAVKTSANDSTHDNTDQSKTELTEKVLKNVTLPESQKKQNLVTNKFEKHSPGVTYKQTNITKPTDGVSVKNSEEMSQLAKKSSGVVPVKSREEQVSVRRTPVEEQVRWSTSLTKYETKKSVEDIKPKANSAEATVLKNFLKKVAAAASGRNASTLATSKSTHQTNRKRKVSSEDKNTDSNNSAGTPNTPIPEPSLISDKSVSTSSNLVKEDEALKAFIKSHPSYIPFSTNTFVGNYKFPCRTKNQETPSIHSVASIFKDAKLYCALHEVIIQLKLADIPKTNVISASAADLKAIRLIRPLQIKENLNLRLIPLQDVRNEFVAHHGPLNDIRSESVSPTIEVAGQVSKVDLHDSSINDSMKSMTPLLIPNDTSSNTNNSANSGNESPSRLILLPATINKFKNRMAKSFQKILPKIPPQSTEDTVLAVFSPESNDMPVGFVNSDITVVPLQVERQNLSTDSSAGRIPTVDTERDSTPLNNTSQQANLIVATSAVDDSQEHRMATMEPVSPKSVSEQLLDTIPTNIDLKRPSTDDKPSNQPSTDALSEQPSLKRVNSRKPTHELLQLQDTDTTVVTDHSRPTIPSETPEAAPPTALLSKSTELESQLKPMEKKENSGSVEIISSTKTANQISEKTAVNEMPISTSTSLEQQSKNLTKECEIVNKEREKLENEPTEKVDEEKSKQARNENHTVKEASAESTSGSESIQMVNDTRKLIDELPELDYEPPPSVHIEGPIFEAPPSVAPPSVGPTDVSTPSEKVPNDALSLLDQLTNLVTEPQNLQKAKQQKVCDVFNERASPTQSSKTPQPSKTSDKGKKIDAVEKTTPKQSAYKTITEPISPLNPPNLFIRQDEEKITPVSKSDDKNAFTGMSMNMFVQPSTPGPSLSSACQTTKSFAITQTTNSSTTAISSESQGANPQHSSINSVNANQTAISSVKVTYADTGVSTVENSGTSTSANTTTIASAIITTMPTSITNTTVKDDDPDVQILSIKDVSPTMKKLSSATVSAVEMLNTLSNTPMLDEYGKYAGNNQPVLKCMESENLSHVVLDIYHEKNLEQVRATYKGQLHLNQGRYSGLSPFVVTCNVCKQAFGPLDFMSHREPTDPLPKAGTSIWEHSIQFLEPTGATDVELRQKKRFWNLFCDWFTQMSQNFENAERIGQKRNAVNNVNAKTNFTRKNSSSSGQTTSFDFIPPSPRPQQMIPEKPISERRTPPQTRTAGYQVVQPPVSNKSVVGTNKSTELTNISAASVITAVSTPTVHHAAPTHSSRSLRQRLGVAVSHSQTAYQQSQHLPQQQMAAGQQASFQPASNYRHTTLHNEKGSLSDINVESIQQFLQTCKNYTNAVPRLSLTNSATNPPFQHLVHPLQSPTTTPAQSISPQSTNPQGSSSTGGKVLRDAAVHKANNFHEVLSSQRAGIAWIEQEFSRLKSENSVLRDELEAEKRRRALDKEALTRENEQLKQALAARGQSWFPHR